MMSYTRGSYYYSFLSLALFKMQYHQNRKCGWSQRGWSEWEIDQKAVDLVGGFVLIPLPPPTYVIICSMDRLLMSEETLKEVLLSQVKAWNNLQMVVFYLFLISEVHLFLLHFYTHISRNPVGTVDNPGGVFIHVLCSWIHLLLRLSGMH